MYKNIDHICVTTVLSCFGNWCDNQNDNKIKKKLKRNRLTFI